MNYAKGPDQQTKKTQKYQKREVGIHIFVYT
jgi:hypothetical protein